MVNCNDCKFFKAECIEGIFAGICEYGDHFDFMEPWQVENGTCDIYEHMDCDNSEN